MIKSKLIESGWYSDYEHILAHYIPKQIARYHASTLCNTGIKISRLSSPKNKTACKECDRLRQLDLYHHAGQRTYDPSYTDDKYLGIDWHIIKQRGR